MFPVNGPDALVLTPLSTVNPGAAATVTVAVSLSGPVSALSPVAVF